MNKCPNCGCEWAAKELSNRLDDAKAEAPDVSVVANARRYEWLRSMATFGRYPFGDPPAHRWKFPHVVDNLKETPENDFAALDACIDAAMSAERGKG